MGISASVVDQKRLYEELKSQLTTAQDTSKEEHTTDDYEYDDDLQSKLSEDHKHDAVSDNTTRFSSQENALYWTVNKSYKTWYKSVQLKQDISFCALTDFEDALTNAFKLGKTPLILDTSPDDRICTFFSYQPDVVILDAKSMVMAMGSGSTKQQQTNRITFEVRVKALDVARKTLVNAMKFGKLLVIRLGTSAPDFMHTFSDESLDIDTTKASTAYFPLVVFEQGGSLLHDVGVEFGEGGRRTSAKGPSGSQRHAPTRASPEDRLHDSSPATRDKSPSWAERLFREEDMRPHKNFALCRDEFRVCVTSQLPWEHVEEFLFGAAAEGEHGSGESQSEYRGNLPNRSLFKIVSIVPDSEDISLVEAKTDAVAHFT